jgi:methylphosphotriester-DNA--protein-cysteine methyltransferase
MAYLQYIPGSPLNAYIDDIYYLDGPAPYARLKILPMPSLHLIINLGDRCQVYEPTHAKPAGRPIASCWVGLWSTHYVVEYPATLRLYGIHFKPGGAHPFLRMPLSELHNDIVALDAIWAQEAAELCERLHDAPTIRAGFALLERMLTTRLRKTSELDMVRFAIAEIARLSGALPIRGLSNAIGISQNHLTTQFKRIAGVPPKQLARFYRFARVLRSVRPEHAVDWTAIAHDTGFYDQSHFNKDFAAFTGFSPGHYLQLRRRLHEENPEQARSLGQMLTE